VAQAQSLRDKVVQYCTQNVGKKVGSGQCSSVAYNALIAAGCKQLNDFHDSPGKGDYVWGKLVCDWESSSGGRPGSRSGSVRSILPGDVIQFRNTEFKGSGYSWSFDHHTAVVKSFNPSTGALVVFQQNVNGKQCVMVSSMNLNDLKKGWLRVYEPEAKQGQNQNQKLRKKK
jgi:hypothetical protein